MPKSVDVLLVRHGEQERDGRDGALTSRGAAQAAALSEAIALGPADRLVSSTLTRAVATARALGREPEPVGELDEFRFSDSWTWADAEAREDLTLWRPEHGQGVETLREFQVRVTSAFESLIGHTEHGRLILVVHSGVIDAILRWLFGAGPDQPWLTEADVAHASITELTYWPQGRHARGAPRHTVVRRLGDTRHLPPRLVTSATHGG